MRGRRERDERAERLVTNVERLRRRTHAVGPAPLERSERRMRIALLAPADSPHTRRWADFYAGRGIEVYAISLDTQRDPDPSRPRVRTAYLPTLRGGPSGGWASPRTVTRLRALLDQARPDVVHAHLVGSYALLGALAGRHPYVVSVTGDTEPSGDRRRMVDYALRRADAVVQIGSETGDDTDDSDTWNRNATQMLDVYAGLGLRGK
jgi:hypothetical protein